MIETKFNKAIEFLSNQNIRIDRLIPDCVKCLICEDILYNAIQALCGCRFCFQCMEELKQKGIIFCPGRSENCKTQQLSELENKLLGPCANEELARLLITCPKAMCSVKTSLVDIEQHMEICGQQKIRCPFFRRNCKKKFVVRNKMLHHLYWHKENRGDFLMSVVEGADGSDDDSLCNILVDITKIKTSICKIDSLCQIQRKKFQDDVRNLSIEFQVNLNKLSNDIETLKQIQQTSIDTQFLEELEKKVSKANSPVEQGERSIQVAHSLNEWNDLMELKTINNNPVVPRSNMKPNQLDSKRNNVKLSKSNQLAKRSIWDSLRASLMKKKRKNKIMTTS